MGENDFTIITPNGPVATVSVFAVCHVCQRAPVCKRAGRQVGRACAQCLHIETRIAAAYGARLLTPLDDGWATGNQVLHYRLWGPATPSLEELLRNHHLGRVKQLRAEAESLGVRGLVIRYPGGPPWALYLSEGPWSEQYAASRLASVHGYQDYVTAVHPWVDSVEPRVADVEWLSEMAQLPEA